MAALSAQLQAFHDGMMERITPAEAKIITSALDQYRADGVGAHARQVGDTAPEFSLPDQQQTIVTLAAHLAHGPVVLLFYRGGWSPLCELTLRAWQAIRPRLRQAGAEVLAISPDKPADTAATASCHGIRFPLLSDPENQVAAAYGLDFQMPAELKALYRRYNAAVGRCCHTWRLPLTAGYVIAPDGIIREAQVDLRTYRRLEPQAALAAVQSLRRALAA